MRDQLLSQGPPKTSSEDKALFHVHATVKQKRLDLHSIRLYNNTVPPTADKNRENYLVLGKQQLVLNHYSKTGITPNSPGNLSCEHLPVSLVQHIKQSIQRYPRAHLFSDRDLGDLPVPTPLLISTLHPFIYLIWSNPSLLGV